MTEFGLDLGSLGPDNMHNMFYCSGNDSGEIRLAVPLEATKKPEKYPVYIAGFFSYNLFS
jgi:hypothetical protein